MRRNVACSCKGALGFRLKHSFVRRFSYFLVSFELNVRDTNALNIQLRYKAVYINL